MVGLLNHNHESVLWFLHLFHSEIIWPLSDRHGPFKHRREARLIDCYVAKANKKLQADCFKIVSRIAYLLWWETRSNWSKNNYLDSARRTCAENDIIL